MIRFTDFAGLPVLPLIARDCGRSAIPLRLGRGRPSIRWGPVMLAVVLGLALALAVSPPHSVEAQVQQTCALPGFDPDVNPGLLADCETLLAIKDALVEEGGTGGPLNWSREVGFRGGQSVGTPFDAWEGVDTGGEPRRVRGLNLEGRLLEGRIPDRLGDLSYLEVLNLGDTDLRGTIPAALGRLSRLRVLNLKSNYMEGGIPESLGSLTRLEVLDLEYSQLSGQIPSLGSLTELRVLNLARNQLTGQIPSLNRLTRLEVVNLYNNRLTGQIPSLNGLTRLEVLDLFNNRLTGQIPSLDNLTRLEALDLRSNQLTGRIPSLNRLGNLKWLLLGNNRLSGALPIPSEGALPGLLWLDLLHNQLSGSIPPALSGLPTLARLTTHYNQFTPPYRWTGPTCRNSRLTFLKAAPEQSPI